MLEQISLDFQSIEITYGGGTASAAVRTGELSPIRLRRPSAAAAFVKTRSPFWASTRIVSPSPKSPSSSRSASGFSSSRWIARFSGRAP